MAKTRSTSRKNTASEDGPDPRLVDLVRYLARRAAEHDYETFRQGHDRSDGDPAGGKEAT